MNAATLLEIPAGYPFSGNNTQTRNFIETSGRSTNSQTCTISASPNPPSGKASRATSPSPELGSPPRPRPQAHINDPRKSPAITIIVELAIPGANVQSYSPFAPSGTKAGECASDGSVKDALSGAECAVFLVDRCGMRGRARWRWCWEGRGKMGIVDGEELFVGHEKGTCIVGYRCMRDNNVS